MPLVGLRQRRREGAFADEGNKDGRGIVEVQGGCGARPTLKEEALASCTEGRGWTFRSTKSWAVAKLPAGTVFRPEAAEPRADSGEPFVNGGRVGLRGDRPRTQSPGMTMVSLGLSPAHSSLSQGSLAFTVSWVS